VISLRLLGIALGALGVLHAFARFRRGRSRRADFALRSLVSLAVLVVSLQPNTVNVVRDMLALERQQFSRLIAIAIVSNALLWVLLFATRDQLSIASSQFDRLVRRLGAAEFARAYPEQEAITPVVVVIPAFNEEASIGAVLAQMPASVCGLPLTVLVVDDGSSDSTAAAARQAGARVVASPLNRGGGAALRLGFDIARERGAQIIVTMDADGQHLPAEIERLVRPILAGEADFVIGSRLLGERERDSALRLAGIHVFNVVIRLLTAVRVSDCSNGFRAFHTAELDRVLLRQDQFHTSELIIEAARKGIRIAEAPVTVRRRLSGSSKKGRPLRYGLAFARTVLKTWWR